MTTEHAARYKKLVHDLAEAVPTRDKALETAQCRKLMAVYDGDLAARYKAYDWGTKKTIKKFDNILIAQLSVDILDRLETILRSATEPVSIVFYNTIKGEYYYYVAEYLTDHDSRKKAIHQDRALSSFLTAKESAVSSAMSVIDPIYLELLICLAKGYHLMGMCRTARLTNNWAYFASEKRKDQLDEEGLKLSVDIKERMRKLTNSWMDDAVYGISY
ncbi:hypothetical protein BGZ70_009001 [Mortierella alpina]|uniref:14-3-3 domain-containing protein n=1 Tax=Mortierella alpina TaxID=64518 RepID=A0A9P6M0U6_MORAP|nr:hypothetical protein BGZ70_009001 [Mortierella alpina]